MVSHGSVARVSGLEKAAHLNDKVGLVLWFVSSKQRWAVVVDGASVMIREDNLTPHDWLRDMHVSATLRNVIVCDEHVAQLTPALSCSAETDPHSAWPASLFEVVSARRRPRQVLVLDLAAFGHHCVLDVWCSGSRLYGRLFHAFVKQIAYTGADQAPCESGFSCGEWVDGSHFAWMEEASLRGFMGKLDSLRQQVTSLTDDWLWEYAEVMTDRQGNVVCENHTDLQKRAWAAKMAKDGASHGLTMQPGSLDLVESYRVEMRSGGYPDNLVVFSGLSLGQEHVIQLLEVPFEYVVPIWKLHKELFTQELHAYQFLRAIEWHGMAQAWVVRSYDIIPDPE